MFSLKNLTIRSKSIKNYLLKVNFDDKILVISRMILLNLGVWVKPL